MKLPFLESIPLPVRTSRWNDEIRELDPEANAEDIVRILANHVFPLEILISLEIAQLRTFTIPSISRILNATAQYEREGVKRLDDTRAILGEIHRPGLASKESREMVEHLNRIHSLYPISNDDFLYTLSTFAFDPAFFIEKWGHRPLSEREKDAFFHLYRKLGEGMKIRELPESRSAFLEWRRAYEARAQTYARENEAVARGLLSAVAKLLPAPVEPLIEPLVVALVDDPGFQTALGLRGPGGGFARRFRKSMSAFRKLSRRVNGFEHLEFWETPFFKRFPTYPDGYDRLRLGPSKVIAMLEKRRRDRDPASVEVVPP